jgi:SagB-type dehydrogenase family enzyme
MALERTLSQRQSVRAFAPKTLTVAQVSQLLWAAQGITRNGRFRTAPSAGALYPLELYLVTGKVDGLEPGVYHYLPRDHSLAKSASGDLRSELSSAALSQRAISSAPAVLVMCAVYDRVTGKYGRRGDRYVHMEAGHAAQNFALQAVALGLASVPIGAFRDAQVQQVIGLSPAFEPLYLLPVGVP